MSGSHVLVSANLEGMVPHLLQRYPDCRFTTVPDHGEVKSAYLDAEVLLRSSMSAEMFDGILAGADALQWVQITAAGFDWIGGPILEDRLARGLTLTRSQGSYNVPIAEYVIAAIMMHSRGFPALSAAQHQQEWVRLVARDVIGSSLLIFGTGAIGREVSWRARGLGVTVTGVNRDGRQVDGFDRVVASSKANTELADADWVVLAMPLTSESHHTIGAAQFAAMQEHAVLVNVGRGGLIEEEALVAAMTGGQIAGAVLDAFEVEPLPAGHRLWDLPNTVITPHTSFRGSGNLDRLRADFCANFDRYRAGEGLVGQKSQPHLGY